MPCLLLSFVEDRVFQQGFQCKLLSLNRSARMFDVEGSWSFYCEKLLIYIIMMANIHQNNFFIQKIEF